jgi:hypothetical protein
MTPVSPNLQVLAERVIQSLVRKVLNALSVVSDAHLKCLVDATH